MNFKFLTAALTLLLVSIPGWASGPVLTTEQILQRVGQAYQRLTDYRLVAARSLVVLSSSQSNTPMSIQGYYDLAVQAPDKVRLVYKEPREVLIVSNGTMTWWVIPRKKEFARTHAAAKVSTEASSSTFLGGGSMVESVKAMLVSGYYNIAQYAPHSALQTSKWLRLNDKKVRCYVIRISFSSGDRTLWIDQSNYLVLRDIDTQVHRFQGLQERMRNTINIKLASIKANFTQNFFDFSPPSNMREVPSLGLPGEGSHIIGKPAADFSLLDSEGNKITLDRLRGKVVVLDFWATWCAPCRVELPTLSQVYTAYKNKGLVVLAISNESRQTVSRFVKRYGISFPALVDPNSQVLREYHITFIPALFVIDRAGVVKAHYTGTWGKIDLLHAISQAGLPN